MNRRVLSLSILSLSLLLITLPAHAENSTIEENDDSIMVAYVKKGIHATNTGQIDLAIDFFAQASNLVPAEEQ